MSGGVFPSSSDFVCLLASVFLLLLTSCLSSCVFFSPLLASYRLFFPTQIQIAMQLKPPGFKCDPPTGRSRGAVSGFPASPARPSVYRSTASTHALRSVCSP